MCLDVFAINTRVILEGFRVLYSVVYRRVTKTVAFALRCHSARRNKLNAISNSAMIRFEGFLFVFSRDQMSRCFAIGGGMPPHSHPPKEATCKKSASLAPSIQSLLRNNMAIS